MKKITSFFASGNKKLRICEPEPEQETQSSQTVLQSASCVSSPIEFDSVSSDEVLPSTSDTLDGPSCTDPDYLESPAWPSCWTLEQKNSFCEKNDWLDFHDQKLGCKVCKKVGSLGVERKNGMKISKEWANIEVTSYGTKRSQQLTSLRKKIFEHKESSVHKAALKILLERKNEHLEKVCLKHLAQEKDITIKMFRTAYKIAKENQSFNSFCSEIDLQELNGVNMGRILHSTNACINIVNHITQEMRKNLVNEVIRSKTKIALIIDESTTLSQKSTLIVYIRFLLANSAMDSHVNLFLDLVQLESVNAKGIFTSLLNCLHSYGIMDDYLRQHLISVTCDGAAVMLGNKSGVGTLLKEQFPSIILWHCANHRLELSVGDTVKQTSGINRFKAFLDKLYVLYHASPKNSRELQACASSLEAQLLKIGRVLSTRWVASSFRSVLAVWQSYRVLVRHFEEAKQDTTRDKTERCMYEGLLRKITSTNFLLDLGLMCDALQELSELSLVLQERRINLYRANKKIQTVVQLFESRRTEPGSYYKEAAAASEKLSFQGISLYRKEAKNDPPISPDVFYEKLKSSIESRLLTENDSVFANCTRVLDSKHWPDNVEKKLTFGEDEIRNMSIRFQLNERKMIHAFREYLIEKTLPDDLRPLINAIESIPISSSECERGFSQMNLIVTPNRASLLTTTISGLLFIRVNGPPLRCFDPSKYVDSWLLRGRHAATDVRSKERSREEAHDKNAEIIWKCL